jgi:MFS family permease
MSDQTPDDASRLSTVEPTPAQAKGMRVFWFDGFFAWFSEWIVVQYLAVYALAFGASDSQIGYLAALVSLSGALALLPGARLAERWGRRKLVVIVTGGSVARMMLLGLAVLPFFSQGKEVVYAIMALGAARVFFVNLGIPAWTSLSADVVPLSLRGRFFSSRNFGMGVGALIGAPLAGLMISRIGFPEGWQSAWTLALVAGLLSTAFYSRIPDREIERAIPQSGRTEETSGGVMGDKNFIAFCAVAFIWNLALYVAAPFFNVHLVRNMGGNATWVGALSAINSVSALAGQPVAGRLLDERGSRWLMAVTGLTIPFLPLAWIAATAPWHVIFINAAGGALWAGYNLAVFNLLLFISPSEKRAFYSAVYQSMVFTSAFAGPLLGGFLGEMYGLPLLFAISSGGRLTAGLLFLALVRERPATSEFPARHRLPGLGLSPERSRHGE